MTLLKQINTPTLLLPYEQLYIQSFHHNNELIREQHPNEHKPMFDLLHSNTAHHNPPDPYPQFHVLHPVLSQPVHGTTTYRVRDNSQIAFSVDSAISVK